MQQSNQRVLPNSVNSRQFTYFLLPGNCPPNFSQIELHNQAFQHWKFFWNKVFKEISGEAVRAEDFWRQKYVCVLKTGQQIAAIHLYSFFNLESAAALAQPYFSLNYTDHSLTSLQKTGVNSVMSMEYLTVAPEFRQNALGYPLSSVIIGLGYKVLKESGYDAMIAPCRIDLKVDLRARDFGAEPFSNQFVHHGVPVVNMVTHKANLREHPNQILNTMIQDLWRRRLDYSGNYYLDRDSIPSAA